MRRHVPRPDRSRHRLDEAGRHADVARLPDPPRAGRRHRPAGRGRHARAGAGARRAVVRRDRRAASRAQQHFATIVLGDEVDGAFVTGGRIVAGADRATSASSVTSSSSRRGSSASAARSAASRCTPVREASRPAPSRELRRTPAAIVERTGIMVARACASIAAMLDVSEIVLGGVVPSTFGEPFFEALGREFEQRSGLQAPRAAPDPRRRVEPDRPTRRPLPPSPVTTDSTADSRASSVGRAQ